MRRDIESYYIVQFDGPVTEADRASIEALGGSIYGYIPEYAYKVKMTGSEALQVSALKNIIWTGAFQPAYRISPEIIVNGTRLYKIRVESGTSPIGLVNRINATGATLMRQDGNILIVAANEAQLNRIAFITDVAWIENFVIFETQNEYGAGQIIKATIANTNGYDGSTQTVAVADTGLGGGTPSTAHPDIPASRITNIFDWGTNYSDSCYTLIDDGAIDVDSGHGTHVTTSVLGDGDANGVGRGTAPAANLVFQAIEDFADFKGFCSFQYADGYYLLGLPDDLTALFQQAYDAGARIHSNSWGSDAAGDYTADSATVDTFIWNNSDMLITFSAGNAGTDANSDGVIDNDSIGSPATAKNALTVGASENDRQGNWDCDTGLSYTDCAAQGGQNNIFTWGAAWPSDYPVDPIASDPSAGNSEQMAAFSSRGPTDDGRIKPDVVAPGSWILSGYSDLYQQEYDGSTNPQNNAWQYDGYGFPYSKDYKYMSGTSMSNPITAGGAAVVRDYYQKAESHAASAALVKATLINSAVDMLDENGDGVNDNDFPIPNVHEGWGLLDLAAATDGSHQFVDNTTGLSTGNNAQYQFSVNSGGSFKVSLVWSDYPSTEAAANNLVNNLDLTVSGPNGTYKGNVFNNGWSTTGGNADSVNNVENVYVQNAQAGTWTVTVNGTNVPQGAQPFALVVDGVFGTPPPTSTPVPPTSTSVPPTATSVPPTATSVLPTATSAPPTATSVPPTATSVPPTATSVPPTATSVPPTATSVPPTATSVPPTSTPVPSNDPIIYVSSSSGGNAGGVGFSDEDILAYDTATGTYSMFFDGSDVGLSGSGARDIDAFYILDDGSILISVVSATTLPNVGSVDDSDILRFIPTSTGSNTAGTFEWYFDGSDVGLTRNGEDVDAIYILANGDILISTSGSFSVPGASGRDEDLVRFSPTSLGAGTSGSWSAYFDGSDVALNNSGGEDVHGAWVDEAGVDIYLTTRGSFSVSGVSGTATDIFTCNAASTGSATSCSSFSMFWDGSANGYGSEVLDGFQIK